MNYQDVLDRLKKQNQDFNQFFPGDLGRPQAIHTVYGGAQLFKSDTTKKLGEKALQSLEVFAADSAIFAKALGLPSHERLAEQLGAVSSNPEAFKTSDPDLWIAHAVYQRTVNKLKTQAVEDFRIDFEDGYGYRPDAEEDERAEIAANELAKGIKENTVSPFIGIRIKPFTEELAKRGLKTLDIFLSTLLKSGDGKLPDNFVVTLPKVTFKEQVEALADVFDQMEPRFGLAKNSLKLEIMVEMPQSIIDKDGNCPLRSFVDAARGRCTGAHFGTYDYTAGCNITADYQTMDHPSCDFAKQAMLVNLAGTGVHISDGATNVMPVAPLRVDKLGRALTKEEINSNFEAVYSAWRLSHSHINHSLKGGFYQGWDLHPAQLPIRYATVYNFFLRGFAESTARLKGFMEKAAQATLLGDVFDDAATGQGLLNYFIRGYLSGAITEEEIAETGLTKAEIETRSFVKILDGRRA